MPREPVIFNEDYKGSRWTYGFQNRPPGYAHNPNGFIVGSDREHPAFRWGTIDYPKPLTDKECSSYELTFVSAQLTPDSVDDCVIYPNKSCWSDGSKLYVQYADKKDLWALNLKANASKLYDLTPIVVFNQEIRLG